VIPFLKADMLGKGSVTCLHLQATECKGTLFSLHDHEPWLYILCII